MSCDNGTVGRGYARPMVSHLVALTALVLLVVGCGGTSGDIDPVEPSVSSSSEVTPPGGSGSVQECADVVDVRFEGDGTTYRFDVTVRSGDTGWDKYADAWEVRAPDGVVLGERVLLHPHETEQPFTRSLSGVVVPDGVDEVVVAARDSVNGYCGATMTVAVRP